MPDSSNARPRRRKKKRSVLYAPMSFILICAVMFFGMSVFFRVSVIEVEGSFTYSDEEVIEASGLEMGDYMLFINRFTATSNIFSKLPYVEKVVSIERKLPNRVVITIAESAAIAYVPLDGEFWIMDRNCKLLKTVAAAETQGLISLLGITPVAPMTGEGLSVESGELPKVEYAAAILGELLERGMSEDVRWLDMNNVGSPSFDYLGRYVIRMGTNENIKYKLDRLHAAVELLKEGDRGIIDLSVDRAAQFLPE